MRPHCDALYPSELEPWSAYLTGREGLPPEPIYDPLAFWVDEAHARGLQLHAWFNPYRAAHPSRPGPPSEGSVLVTRPEMCVTLGDGGYRWLDPARADVQRHSLAVILDVVRRYDVDGVHFDDYFYPYPSYADGAELPRRGDVARLSAGRRPARPRGLAPTRRRPLRPGRRPRGPSRGSGRPVQRQSVRDLAPGEPEGIAGFDAHEELYADARRWLREGWVDALVPQLYWPIGRVAQSFPVLLGWWERQNPLGRHVWAGTSIARMEGEEGATELVNQVMVTRGMTPESPGTCLFSARWLLREGNQLGPALVDGPFDAPALPPESPWLVVRKPRRPDLRPAGSGGVLFGARGAEGALLRWLLGRRGAGRLEAEASFREPRRRRRCRGALRAQRSAR